MPDAVYPVDYPGDFPVFPAIGPDSPVSFHSIASGITPLLPITRHGARHDCIGKDQDMKAYPTSTVMIATVWIILISGARNQFRRQVIEVVRGFRSSGHRLGYLASSMDIGPGASAGDYFAINAIIMTPNPSEFAIGGVYLPPMLIAAVFGIIAALLTARLLNRYRLSRYFFYPPLVFLALMVIYTLLIGEFIIGI